MADLVGSWARGKEVLAASASAAKSTLAVLSHGPLDQSIESTNCYCHPPATATRRKCEYDLETQTCPSELDSEPASGGVWNKL
jgi:hypothetical protein